MPAARFRSGPHRKGRVERKKVERVRVPGIFPRCFFDSFFATEMPMIHVARFKKLNPSFSIVKSICKGTCLPFAGEVSFAEPSLRFICSDVVMQGERLLPCMAL